MTSAPAAHGRLTWMDSLRGLAIVLIVVLHASALSALLSGVPSPPWLQQINAAVLPYRMPMLMLLSGMLLQRALAKSPGRYALGKVRTLVWPYLLWVVVYWLVIGVDDVPAWQDWIATSWLWYIFFLAAYYAVAPVVVRVPLWVPSVVFWAASALTPDPQWTDLLLFAGYFFAGHAVWAHRALLARLDRWPVTVAALAVTFGLAVGYVAQEAGAAFLVPLRRDELLYAPLTLIGVAGLVLVARRIPDRVTGVLRFLGRNSVVFYLTHYPIQILVTETLGRFELWDWRLHVGLGVAMSLVVGTALVQLRRFRPVDALFVLPWPRARARTL